MNEEKIVPNESEEAIVEADDVEIEELTSEAMIEKLTEEKEKFKNEYFKAHAETQNYKKRAQRELDNALKYRIQSFAIEVLPVLDNLERALNAPSDDESFKSGIQMIYDQLKNALSNEGVKEIDALDQPFDPNKHQAFMTEKVEDKESNIVIEVFQKGYTLKDRVLRVAMVKVSE